MGRLPCLVLCTGDAIYRVWWLPIIVKVQGAEVVLTLLSWSPAVCFLSSDARERDQMLLRASLAGWVWYCSLLT